MFAVVVVGLVAVVVVGAVVVVAVVIVAVALIVVIVASYLLRGPGRVMLQGQAELEGPWGRGEAGQGQTAPAWDRTVQCTGIWSIELGFRTAPLKSGLYTVRLTLSFTGICSVLNLGQLWASYSLLFKSKSLKNRGKSSVVV